MVKILISTDGNPVPCAQMSSLAISPSPMAHTTASESNSIHEQSNIDPPPAYSVQPRTFGSVPMGPPDLKSPAVTQPWRAMTEPTSLHQKNPRQYSMTKGNMSFNSHDASGLSLMFGGGGGGGGGGGTDSANCLPSGSRPDTRRMPSDVTSHSGSSASFISNAQQGQFGFDQTRIQHNPSATSMDAGSSTGPRHHFPVGRRPEVSPIQHPPQPESNFRTHTSRASEGSLGVNHNNQAWPQTSTAIESEWPPTGVSQSSRVSQSQDSQFFTHSNRSERLTSWDSGSTSNRNSLQSSMMHPAPSPSLTVSSVQTQRPGWDQPISPTSNWGNVNLVSQTGFVSSQPEMFSPRTSISSTSPRPGFRDPTFGVQRDTERGVTPTPFVESEIRLSTIPPGMIYNQGAGNSPGVTLTQPMAPSAAPCFAQNINNDIPQPTMQQVQRPVRRPVPQPTPQLAPHLAPHQTLQPALHDRRHLQNFQSSHNPFVDWQTWEPLRGPESSARDEGANRTQGETRHHSQEQWIQRNSQAGLFSDGIIAINQQPQELPAVQFAPDPVELPCTTSTADIRSSSRFYQSN